MMIDKKFKGVNFNRTNRNKNLLEKIYVNEWQKANACLPETLLSCLTNNNDSSLSDRDWLVASTIIQWLGSDVGKFFIENVLEKYNSLKEQYE